jgi:stage II sporulation protein D
MNYKAIIRNSLRVTIGLSILAIFWSCASVPVLQEDSPGSVIRLPFVRVLIGDGQPERVISARMTFAVECLKGESQSVYYSSRPVTITRKQIGLTVTYADGEQIESGLSEVNFIPRGNNNRLRFEGKTFRGMLKVLPDGQNVQIINVLYMEDYLRGVVPPEIGPRTADEIEAVKAQAVAARTYAMGHLKQYGSAPYDMKSSIIDQVYEGASVENEIVNKAIDATSGIVATYQDKMISAYYHSTCGGMTDAVSDVWDRKEIPYLRAVADSGACSWSKYYTWKETFTEPQLRGRLEQYLASDRGRDLKIGKVTDVQIAEHTAGGRVVKLTVRTDQDVYRFQKDRIRWAIGRTSNPDLILPSDRFTVNIDRDSRGNILRIDFEGRGYGHGVGMCQCGAIGLSREGWNYRRILSHYYTGIEIKQLY